MSIDHDSTRLEALGEAAHAGLITWESVQQEQARLMPRCQAHDQPTAIIWHDQPTCPLCLEEVQHASRTA